MTAIHQCAPPIWVVTPLGEGFALFLIDYGPSLNSVWVVHLFDLGSVVHVDSAEIKVGGNEMYDIKHPKRPTSRNI